MARIAIFFTALCVLIAALAVPASLAQPPTLRIVSAAPLVVAGNGFRSQELITVTAITSLGPRIVRTRATSVGTFRAQLGVFTQPCGKPFAVRARGAGGSVATLRIKAPPCVPPPRG